MGLELLIEIYKEDGDVVVNQASEFADFALEQLLGFHVGLSSGLLDGFLKQSTHSSRQLRFHNLIAIVLVCSASLDPVREIHNLLLNKNSDTSTRERWSHIPWLARTRSRSSGVIVCTLISGLWVT